MLKSAGNKEGKASSKSAVKDSDFGEMYRRVRENLKIIDYRKGSEKLWLDGYQEKIE